MPCDRFVRLNVGDDVDELRELRDDRIRTRRKSRKACKYDKKRTGLDYDYEWSPGRKNGSA